MHNYRDLLDAVMSSNCCGWYPSGIGPMHMPVTLKTFYAEQEYSCVEQE